MCPAGWTLGSDGLCHLPPTQPTLVPIPMPPQPVDTDGDGVPDQDTDGDGVPDDEDIDPNDPEV